MVTVFRIRGPGVTAMVHVFLCEKSVSDSYGNCETECIPKDGRAPGFSQTLCATLRTSKVQVYSPCPIPPVLVTMETID